MRSGSAGGGTGASSGTVLLTVSGRDRPGLTAALFGALSAFDVAVVDIEQVVIRSRLIVGIALDLVGDSAPLRAALSRTAAELGVEYELIEAEVGELGEAAEAVDPAGTAEPVAAAASGGAPGRAALLHVILLGNQLRPAALADVAQRIAEAGGNITAVTQLARYPVASVELMVQADEASVRPALAGAAAATGLDIAVERAGLARRAKRLVVLDVDSTLVQGEGIDELAARAGVLDEVAAITAAAMGGELDFAESLAARVQLLAGLSRADVERVRDELKLTPGARTLVRTLKRLGYAVGVVSGGFTVLTDRFVAELGLDFAAANVLEFADDRLTGRVLGEAVDRAGKARALIRFAGEFGVPLSQTVAIGDGANDIDMLQVAGLGIAFNAKAALRDRAEVSVNTPFLDAVLYVLGISRSEIEAADLEDADDAVQAGLAG